MAVPSKYRNIGISERAIASYDSFEFASKTGFKTFFGNNSLVSGAALVNYLCSNVTDSADPEEIIVGTVGLIKDYDYDFEFNAPVIIEGLAYLNCTFLVQQTTKTGWIVGNIYHVDRDSNETLLATTMSQGTNGTASGRSARVNITFNLSRRKFTIGEKLRLNIQFYATGAGDSRFYNDPTDRITVAQPDIDGDTPSGSIVFNVPFVTDI